MRVIFSIATRRQQSGESLDEFLLELRRLSKDCNLKAVSAEQYKEELVRDSFINGLSSPLIRQRLLENKTLTLDQAYSQATSLDVAQKNSVAYSQPAVHVAVVDLPSTPEDDNSLCPDVLSQKPPLATTYSKNKCFCCGGISYHRRICPAREAMCHTCGIKGHFSSVCMKKKQGNSVGNVATTYSSSLCALGISAAFTSSLSHELHGPQSDLIVSNSPSCALAAASVDDRTLLVCEC